MRTTPWLYSLALTLVLGRAAHAGNEPSALDAFTRAYTELEALVHAETKPKPETIATRVDSLLDYHWIAVTALGGPSRHAERCAEHCAEFESLLGELVRRSYLRRLEARGEGQVEILGQHVRRKASKVDTRVHYTGEQGEPKTASVDYVMHSVDGRWLVRDILTEGASLVDNYRYELGRLHARGGIDLVIETLRDKLAELDAKG